MRTTFTVEGMMVTQDCGKCAGIFAVTQEFDDACLRDHSKSWQCPYCGEGWSYMGLTAAEKQRNRADRAEADARDVRCRNATLRRRLSATKGVVTRTNNRISNGVCPCCTRSFQNLKRHMTSQHPGYKVGD